tara:strand:- start:808 stop:1581 length:774 start_codon:yes stop_codon:yes gene_type:complete
MKQTFEIKKFSILLIVIATSSAPLFLKKNKTAPLNESEKEIIGRYLTHNRSPEYEDFKLDSNKNCYYAKHYSDSTLRDTFIWELQSKMLYLKSLTGDTIKKYHYPSFGILYPLNNQDPCDNNELMLEHDSVSLYVSNCRRYWEYLPLRDTIKVNVLSFSKKFNSCMILHPNFMIGLTKQGDTIGIVDVELNDVLIVPSKETFVTKYNCLVGLPLSKERYPCVCENKTLATFSYRSGKDADNSIYCAIKKVYYAKIIN